MRLVRRHLLALALVIVAGQVASTVATSAVLCQMNAAEAAARDAIMCTCVHGANAECPMHKGHKAGLPTDPSSRESRWCDGCADTSAMVLTTILFAGPVVDRLLTVAPNTLPERLIGILACPFDVVLALDAPPPRI